jgi:hypothetical protein
MLLRERCQHPDCDQGGVWQYTAIYPGREHLVVNTTHDRAIRTCDGHIQAMLGRLQALPNPPARVRVEPVPTFVPPPQPAMN